MRAESWKQYSNLIKTVINNFDNSVHCITRVSESGPTASSQDVQVVQSSNTAAVRSCSRAVVWPSGRPRGMVRNVARSWPPLVVFATKVSITPFLCRFSPQKTRVPSLWKIRRLDVATHPSKTTMENASGPLTVAAQAQSLTPDQSMGVGRISFNDFPAEVKNLIYYYLYRDRTRIPIDLCLLSPAWKSPSPPTALMNTCSTVAAELMPLYFSNCLFTIDTAHKANAQLLAEAFKWLKSVGNKSSAHFRRLRIIHERNSIPLCDYVIIVSINNDKQVIIEEIRGPARYLREARQRRARRNHRATPQERAVDRLYARLDRELTNDLVGTLTRRINNNQTAAMGVSEFELILERISFHVSRFNERRRAF